MPGKNRIVKQISLPAPVTVGSVVTAQAPDFASPARPLPPAPENLVLATTVEQSAATPTARISATWSKPTGVQPERYTIQWSQDSSFPDNATNGQSAAGPSSTIPGLPTITPYYVHVAAWVNNVQGTWSETVSITTANDTVPASQPTSLTGTWIGTGDLQLTWVNPPETNFKVVEIKIYASSGGTLLRTIESAAGRFVYTVAMNLQDTAGVGDASLFIEARSRTFSNITNNVSVPTLTTTKGNPNAPTLTHSWTSDPGTAGADLTLTWTAISDARIYRLALNGGTAREIGGTTYTYPLDRNIADNTTADPTISYSLTAVDGLGQSSTAVTGTATNAAPLAPTTVTMTTGGVSTVAITIAGTPPADFASYTVRVLLNGSPIDTLTKKEAFFVYQATVPGTYQIGVKTVDVFGQSSSSETLSSATLLDFLTTEKLREDSTYSDSIGTNFTLSANKVVLKDDSVGGGITYAASATAYRWTQIEHPLTERIRRASNRYGAVGGGGASFYLALSLDGSTWRWFAGTGADGYTMVERVDEATAQANVSLSTALVNGWVELPITIEARYVKLYHRNTGASYRLDEFYAYTLVVADMIRAGDIQTLHLGAGAVTATKIAAGTITATQLSATAIDSMTITGATIRSAASGARWEGNSTRLFGTDGTTTQWEVLNSTGKLTSGGGVVIQDAGGISIVATSSLSDIRSYKFYKSDGTTLLGRLSALESASPSHNVTLNAEPVAGDDSSLSLNSYAPSGGKTSNVFLRAQAGTPSALITLTSDGTTPTITVTASGGTAISSGGLNMGSATGAATGEIKTSGDVVVGTGSVAVAALNGVRIARAADCYLTASDGTRSLIAGVASSVGGIAGTLSNHDFALRSNNIDRIILKANGNEGFFGSGGAAKPTVTGSRGGNAALASFLTGIASLGLITDSTTA